MYGTSDNNLDSWKTGHVVKSVSIEYFIKSANSLLESYRRKNPQYFVVSSAMILLFARLEKYPEDFERSGDLYYYKGLLIKENPSTHDTDISIMI